MADYAIDKIEADLRKDNPELFASLQKTANDKKVTIISFVAPQNVVRVSPTQVTWAEISEYEMFKLEEYVKKAQTTPNASENLHLVIHTPGGQLYTSYKIAYFLREKFANIEAYIPYEAASGGTILCCAANVIHLGDLGNLTPIDPQVPYMDGRVSAFAFERASDFIQEEFGKLSPQEIPSPFQQMANKFDPIQYNEYKTVVRSTVSYANTLLEKSKYNTEKALEIAWRLARPYRTHSNPILKEEAKTLGLNIVDDNVTMEDYSKLVSKCLQKECPNHIIIPFYPEAPKVTPLPISSGG